MPLKSSLKTKKIKFTLGVSGTTARVGIGTLFFICCFETYWLGLGVRQSIAFVRVDAEPIVSVIALFYLAASLYLIYVLILLLLASRWYCKTVYIAFISLAFIAEYSYQKAVGRFTNLYDFIAALLGYTRTASQLDLAFLNYWAILPIILIVACGIFFRDERRFGLKAMAIFTTVSIAFYVHFSYVNEFFFERQFSSSSLVSFCQTTVDFAMYQPVAAIAPPKRETVELPAATNNIPKRNIIFIFDESVRADHLSLNGYRRKTTPYLEELAQRHLLKNWGYRRFHGYVQSYEL